MNGDINAPRYSPGTPTGGPGQATSPAPAVSQPSPAPMKSGKGRGFMKLLLWLVLFALVAGGVYYWQNQKVSDLNKKLADANSQISRLNTQNYNYQQQLQSATQKSQAQNLTVKEWGVKIPVTSATSDMEYTIATFNAKANAQASFRTKQLDTMFPNCTTDSVVIVRGLAADTFSGTGANAKTFKQQYDALLADKNADWTKNFKPQLIGTYYYIQGQSGAACATKAADVTQENQILQAVKDALNKMAAA